MGFEHSIARIHTEILNLKERIERIEQRLDSVGEVFNVYQDTQYPDCEFEDSVPFEKKQKGLIQQMLDRHDHNITTRQDTKE